MMIDDDRPVATADPGHRSWRKVTQEDVREWDDVRARTLAEMAYSAAPDFYDLVPLPHQEVLRLIVDQLGAPLTETSDLHVLSHDGGQIAMFCAVPSEALYRAQQDATLALIRRLDRASKGLYMAGLSTYTPSVEPLDVDSSYLTRIAVSIGTRRSGVGAAALQRFIERSAARPCSLHVKADNLPAISLYQKFGFQFISDTSFPFRAMLRNP